MATSLVYFCGGIIGLWLSGDFVMKKIILSSKIFGFSALVTGIIILPLATGFPELAVAIQSILSGAPSLSAADIIGANMVNITHCLGIPALFIGPIIFPPQKKSRFLILTSLMLMIMSGLFTLQQIPYQIGFILVAAYIVFIWWIWIEEKKALLTQKILNDDAQQKTFVFSEKLSAIMHLIIGLIALIISAKITVNSSLALAKIFSLNIEKFGAIVLAVATSLPEIMLSFFAIKKGEYEIALGNALGASLEQGALILGILLLASKKTIDLSQIIIITPFFIATYLLVAIKIIYGKSISRIDGSILIALWLSFAIASYGFY